QSRRRSMDRQEQAAEQQDDAPLDRRAQRRADAQARQKLAVQRRPLEKKLQSVETQMDHCNLRLEELNALIADPDFYSDARRDERMHLLAEHGELSKSHQTLEEQWLELQEQLESL